MAAKYETNPYERRLIRAGQRYEENKAFINKCFNEYILNLYPICPESFTIEQLKRAFTTGFTSGAYHGLAAEQTPPEGGEQEPAKC